MLIPGGCPNSAKCNPGRYKSGLGCIHEWLWGLRIKWTINTWLSNKILDVVLSLIKILEFALKCLISCIIYFIVTKLRFVCKSFFLFTFRINREILRMAQTVTLVSKDLHLVNHLTRSLEATCYTYKNTASKISLINSQMFGGVNVVIGL